ncbi:MAG: hypothetical protein GWN99_16575 [Gemmatimonadetes bacterium]|uniref:Alginate export domain-containing protein n=1 Tax=Candidatus Kutchimonas denitrificans TaxID=3056748 RepID=A0AAE4Z6S6_9BACT|nr:hypothetical protein [Gemmatimonadota bacterium]NIR74404.1 hypothetical protein [Candidatus Kutchimonas denitrificans]NIS02655.1 hypothetical protein [Gemmatimonadota bacterium]NIT68530.1 hypothetical protein [Gemmatimonadota bacterium]NIU52007.1 hypothetical protein [Gemmatimonadota bacterium]
MRPKAPSRLLRLLLLSGLVALAPACPSKPAAAQPDSSSARPPRATLLGWEESVRFAIFDRAGSTRGRNSRRGILQRFDEAMDAEYDLDIISSDFSLTETYAWHRRENGARFWAGSIDHLQLIQQGDLKARVVLGSGWSIKARFVHDESLRTERNLLWLGFARRFAEGRYSVFVQGTLRARKPESDVELGFSWNAEHARVTVAAAALDLFNDLIFQTLEVDPGVTDTTLDYTSHPFTLRVIADLTLGRGVRAELVGLVMSPTTVVAAAGPGRLPGFEQDERYAYAGGLLGWEPSAGSGLGGFATWVRARLDREPLAAGRPEDAFELTETTSSLGIYGIHELTPQLTAEGWAARIWRLEDRIPTGASEVEYEDRTWAGRASVTHGARRGLNVSLGLDVTVRRVSGPPPVVTLEPLGSDNFRLRVDLGWRFGGQAGLVAGAGLDLDTGRFDGAHGRFRLYW